MAQHDYSIANQGFPAFRSDLNNGLAAIVSNNSGATEPSTMFAHQIWVDTAANPSILKIRNADNDAWITIGSIDQTGDTFTMVNLKTSGPVVFNDAGADVDFRVEGDTDANLLFVDASTDRVGVGTSSPGARLNPAFDGTSGSTAELVRLTNGSGGGSGTGTSLTYYHSLNTGALVEGGRIAVVKEATWITTASTQDANMQFWTTANGTAEERMRIDSNGNVFVGTTSGSNPGCVLSPAGIVSGTVSAAVTNPFQSWNQATSGNNKFAEFYTEGGGGSLRGSIDFNRAATLTRYNTISDATLKNIIGDADGQKSVEILNSTRIREYAWKDDETQKPQIGVIAQELHETFKGAVSVGGDFERQRDVTEEVEEEYIDEDGNTQTHTVTNVVGQETYTAYRPWGVDKTAFTFHLVAGWQAHEKTIKQQADMIAALEARIASLEGV